MGHFPSVSIFAPNALALAFFAVTVVGFFVSLGLVVDKDSVLASLLGNGFALYFVVILEEVHVGILSVKFVLESFQLPKCFALVQGLFFIQNLSPGGDFLRVNKVDLFALVPSHLYS